MNILLARTDRLGDLLQSIICLRGLKQGPNEDKIGFLISQPNYPVIKNNPYVDRIHFVEQATSAELRHFKYDASIVMVYDPHAARLIHEAGIPRRIGPLSKAGSFFRFNEGIRQHRGASIKNEAEYNLDLVRAVYPAVRGERPMVYNAGTPPSFELPPKFAVIAPQTRNSAPNVTDDTYCELCAAITGTGTPVILCGTENDARCRRMTSGGTHVLNACGETSLDELIYVLRRSLFVVAPSTGTLHLANALGKPIISFYPSNKSIGDLRWSPYRYTGTIFASSYRCSKKCPKTRTCSHRCMSFDTKEIITEIRRMLQAF